MKPDYEKENPKKGDKKDSDECKKIRPPLHHCFHFIDQNGDFVSSCCCC